MNQSQSKSYAAAGVDITAGYRAVELMKKAKAVINAGVTIGSCNQKMASLLAEAEKLENYQTIK